MSDIVLTADRTLMTDYNGFSILGHVGCFPNRLIPNFIIDQLFPKLDDGQATYAIRRLESKLIDEGFDVKVLPPQEIKKIKKIKPKIVGISTVDPLTRKPHPWTLTNIFGGGESVIETEFYKLLQKINEMKNHQDFKIIIGGPGTSEFENSNKYHDLFDSYVLGSGEGSIPLFQKAINEESLPKKFLSLHPKKLSDISIIKRGSRNGHVQITQGCPRGCQFCGPTLLNWISFPKERIIKEIEINLKAGANQITFITEDFFLYGSKAVEVNNKKIIDLVNSVKKTTDKYNVNSINISDVSIASTIKGKKTCDRISDILGISKECPIDTILGIETGSERLIKKYMEGKSRPYNPNNWSELVYNGINILNENYWYPLCNLITGLPDENENDLIKTLDLVDDIKHFKLYFIIFYFVPLEGSGLENESFFKFDNITDRRWELFYKCYMKTISSLREDLYIIFKNKILASLYARILNEVEYDLKRYRNDPFKLRDFYSSISLKGLNLVLFLMKRRLFQKMIVN
ncbi:MAG: B12-binding domain-containing radical SAM protein [Candidatus Thermoplasmatota archaeon]|nr:B12-binding domain-containing radical SAM protein [Candidatus Thermoplasmatota archaeon]